MTNQEYYARTMLLHNTLVAVGLDISGCDANGNVHLNAPDTNNLVPLVIAAHEKTLASPEVETLKNALGGDTDPRWIAYVDCRKDPIRKARALRYEAETDSMFLKAFEHTEGAIDTEIDGKLVRVPSAEKVEAWESAKAQIRAELPYE